MACKGVSGVVKVFGCRGEICYLEITFVELAYQIRDLSQEYADHEGDYENTQMKFTKCHRKTNARNKLLGFELYEQFPFFDNDCGLFRASS